MNSVLIKLVQHIELAFSATGLALLVGMPIGIWMNTCRKAKALFLGVANVFQTIPSLALLAFLVPLLGIGFKPSITALTVYALLPIIRNTYTGLATIADATIEAAHAMGFTYWQRLRIVELPLAMPVILSGVRIASAMTIGIATIAAFIGAGGLGDFIATGLALGNNRLILLGAIPTALLALAVDFLIGSAETTLSRKKISQWRIGIATIIAISIVVMIGVDLWAKRKPSLVIAGKNFTEQYILVDMMTELLQRYTDLTVKKQFNLETTSVIHAAMLKGDVDIYAEYSGTAYFVVLKQKKSLPDNELLSFVRQSYQRRYGLTWLQPFGFENLQTLAVTRAFASTHHLQNLSDLVRFALPLTLAAPAEFLVREDAYPLLQKNYGFTFKEIRQMEPNLMYTAIDRGMVDVIEAFATDGRLKKYDLVALQDDLQIYPAYEVAPVVRLAVLKAHPEIAQVLNKIAGKIDAKTMRQLNYQVDMKHQSPQKVAHDFLLAEKML